MKKKQGEKKCLPQNKPHGQHQQDFSELQLHRFHFSERKSENKMQDSLNPQELRQKGPHNLY